MDASFPELQQATAVRAITLVKEVSMRTKLCAVIVLIALSSLFSFAQDSPLTVVDNKSAKPRPTPRTGDGHPDLSGYWKGTRDTVPGGNIAKDLPGLKLPLTPAGEAALPHNLTATIDT